jgi:hypothetical protein
MSKKAARRTTTAAAARKPTPAQYRIELAGRLTDLFEEYDGKAYKIDDATRTRIALGIRVLLATLPQR